MEMVENKIAVENLINITLQNRKILYKILTGTPRETLLKVPEGYRNNIWWNIAHIVVIQQRLVYKLSNLELRIDDELAEKFKKGTVPNGKATDEEIDKVKAYLFTTVEWVQEDYIKGRFKNYNEYTTSTKVILNNVEDALTFNLYHEGIHLGVILSLLKAVAKADVTL